MAQNHTSEGRWEHQPDTFGSVEDISDALILREQNTFLVGDYSGNVVAGNNRGLGLYFRDTRHLSTYSLELDGSWPVVLLTTADSGHSCEQVLGNHRFERGEEVAGRCTIELHRRVQVVADGLVERLHLTNFNPFGVTLTVTYCIAADFADIFEVRGHKRRQLEHHRSTACGEHHVRFDYEGADSVRRTTRIAFSPAPSELSETLANFEVSLAPQETRVVAIDVMAASGPSSTVLDAVRAGTRGRASTTVDEEWHRRVARVRTDNYLFSQALEQATSDLRMLWTPNDTGGAYFAAGTPWFATLFGRDSIILALQTLPFMPEIARDCLVVLAERQGKAVNDFRAEQPGKILHEVREGELASIGELPYRQYYGSADATPLFLLLAGEYFAWSGDLAVARNLLPSVRAGLEWITTYGDLDGDGFIEYRTDSLDGLRNQGWKDSTEAVMHADGVLCQGPIALAEVQGYVYSAFQSLSRMFAALGEDAEAKALTNRASSLKQQFEDAFWLKDDGYVAMALDGAKRPARVMSSNAGQVLWSGLLNANAAASIASNLMRPQTFSGWGVRTLASDSFAYNPLGYHVGTVWPHDNAIVAAGLKLYGHTDAVDSIFTGLFEAAATWPHQRLPELFGGHERDRYSRPVPYPVACRPQAWTSGAWFHLLQTTLGLRPSPDLTELHLHQPRLPAFIHDLHIPGVRFRDDRIDLHMDGGALSWTALNGTEARVL
jgi:glycogen debranching enzyme